MKTAIYIEDGVTQFVLTPESDFEKNAVNLFYTNGKLIFVEKGGFYKCAGGWNRHKQDEDSLILRIDKNQ